MQKISARKKAFSLLELSVVILIIGILVFAITTGNNLVRGSKLARARAITLSSQITTIPGMVAWFEGSMKDSFAAGTLATNIQNGAQVTTWFNREPSSYLVRNNLTAAASANVTYQERSVNDIPALNVTIAGKMSLTSFTGPSLTASTVAIVFRPTGTLSTTAKVLADSGTGSSSACTIGIKSTAVSLNGTDSAATFAQNGLYILLVYWNGTSSRVFMNTNTGVANAATATTTLDGFTIGSDRSASTTIGIDAEIPEVIVYNRILKDTERADVLTYLSKKYRIAVTGL